MVSIKKMIVEAKIYIQRSSLYLSIANSFMITYLFVKGAFPKINLAVYGIPIIIGTIIVFILMGYLDDKMNILSMETEAYNARNKDLNDINRKLDEVLKEQKNGK
jgi:hypothetical protein